MQVITKTISRAVVINRTIAVCITLSMMIVFLVTKAVRTTIGTERTIKVGKTFSIERVLVTIPINFAVRIAGAMSVVVTGDIRPWSWISRLNFNDAALKREARKYD